ncbi:membrane protein [Afipia sp. P52-10]|uniref:DedA family protein n=1 Tax=Afipia sp. P52-10 TaxID=1429916 RepID=UPI0003DF0DE8|nr:DedA family protein [Afipia sp. P52-10]ETR77454.1 membrane protein [Afipia sp. P52-10]
MSSLLDQIIQFVSAHVWLAYATVFAAAALEAVPVFGAFVPGSTLIIALSALVAAGELRLAEVIAAAVAGAALGDGASYLAGHIYQRKILGIWPLASYPAVIARSEAFFARRGALAVLLARFVPPVRAFVPVIAGAFGMPPARFFSVNIPAIALWACAHILPAALAGSLWKQYGREVEHIALPLLVIGLLLWVAIWLLRRRKHLAAE